MIFYFGLYLGKLVKKKKVLKKYISQRQTSFQPLRIHKTSSLFSFSSQLNSLFLIQTTCGSSLALFSNLQSSFSSFRSSSMPSNTTALLLPKFSISFRIQIWFSIYLWNCQIVFSVPVQISCKDLVISYIFFFCCLSYCFSFWTIYYIESFSNSLHYFQNCWQEAYIYLRIDQISAFSLYALEIISAACLLFSSSYYISFCLSLISAWVDSGMRPVRCYYIRAWILVWLTTMFQICCRRVLMLSIFYFRIFRQAYFRRLGSLGRSYYGMASGFVSLEELDSYRYSLIPSSILLIANRSHSDTSKGEGSISPFSNLSSLSLFSSDRQSQSRQICPDASTIFLSNNLFDFFFIMLISIISMSSSSLTVQSSFLILIWDLSISYNLVMSSLVTLPFSTSVRKRFLSFKSLEEIELRKISFYCSRFSLLASDQDSPSMSLSRSMEVWLEDWLLTEEGLVFEVTDRRDSVRFYQSSSRFQLFLIFRWIFQQSLSVGQIKKSLILILSKLYGPT